MMTTSRRIFINLITAPIKAHKRTENIIDTSALTQLVDGIGFTSRVVTVD